MEQQTCAGCERSVYTYDACRGCAQPVCYKCWAMGHCQCGNVSAVGNVPMDAVSRAERWLHSLLEWMPRRQTYLEATARQHGFSWRTIERAKQRLRIKAAKHKGEWVWALPPAMRLVTEDDDALDDQIPGAGDHGQF